METYLEGTSLKEASGNTVREILGNPSEKPQPTTYPARNEILVDIPAEILE